MCGDFTHKIAALYLAGPNCAFCSPVFGRVKGLTIKDESGRQRTVELSNEGMADLNVTIYNGNSA